MHPKGGESSIREEDITLGGAGIDAPLSSAAQPMYNAVKCLSETQQNRPIRVIDFLKRPNCFGFAPTIATTRMHGSNFYIALRLS